MPIDDDLRILEAQEKALIFNAFGADEAWRLGSLLRKTLVQRGAGGSVQIDVADHLLFACATAGASPGQCNWIRRKRNTVHHFARSTYAVGRKLERDGTTLSASHGLNEQDYVAHGGGFPIVLQGSGMVGSVVLSGMPQREDHNLVIEAIAELLAVQVPRLQG